MKTRQSKIKNPFMERMQIENQKSKVKTSFLSRRDFINGVIAATTLPFAITTSGKIRFGYAAITWGGDDLQAIKDVSEVGFHGIQIRNNIPKEYGERPQALRELLAQYHLEMVALSSGGLSIAPGTEQAE